MKNFEEIIAKIAEENGTTSENVLREMQLAIDHAYDHHDKDEYTGALKAPVRCFGNHLSGKGKSSFQTDNECGGAAILKK